MKFDDTISIPTAFAIAALAVAGIGAFYNVKEAGAVDHQAIYSLREANLRQDVALAALKADSVGTLAEIKGDLKDLRVTMGDVKISLAILRGRAPLSTNR